jgi:hypothetical protein
LLVVCSTLAPLTRPQLVGRTENGIEQKHSGHNGSALHLPFVSGGACRRQRIEVPTDGSRPEEIYSLNSGGVDFCWFFFLRKRIRVRIFGSTRFTSRVAEPAHDPRRQRSDRGDAPRATARVRAHGASRKGVRARHDRRRRFPPWPNAGSAEDGSGREVEAEIMRPAKP